MVSRYNKRMMRGPHWCRVPALGVSTRAHPLPWNPLRDVGVVAKFVAVDLVLPMSLLPPARVAKGELREEGEERSGDEREGAEVVTVVVMMAMVCVTAVRPVAASSSGLSREHGDDQKGETE